MQSSPAHRAPALRARATTILRRWLDLPRLRRHASCATSPTSTTRCSSTRRGRRRPSSGGRSPTASSSSSPPAYAALGILPPTYEPRATASIPQMQELIARLIERGHAYAADDGSGDVYFDVASWPSYGELTRQKHRRHGGGGGRRPARQARPARLRPVEGRARRTSPSPRVAVAVGRGPPGLAHRVLRDVARATSAPSSTSTAAGSTCASRTTRTSSPSRRRPATRSRATGCTTAS